MDTKRCPQCRAQNSYEHDGFRTCRACGFHAPLDGFGGVETWDTLSVAIQDRDALRRRAAALEAGLRAIEEECECGEWEHPWYEDDAEILRADCTGRTRIQAMARDALAGAYGEVEHVPDVAG